MITARIFAENQFTKQGVVVDMAEGFKMELEEYCSFCGDFVPKVDKTDISRAGDRVGRYLTTIRCENAYKCARIYENMRLKE